MRNPEPTISEIRSRLKKIRNKFYPNLDLSNTEIVISNRLIKAGRITQWYSIPKNKLTISRKYHTHHGWGDELDETLKHEIIHIYLPINCKHGQRYRYERKRTSAKHYSKWIKSEPSRNLYKCNSCSHQFESQVDEVECPKCYDTLECLGEISI